MVALRGQSWPHFTFSTRSQISRSTPSSPVLEPSSVKALIHQSESQQQPFPRRSSDEDCPSTTIFRAFAPHCTGIYSGTANPSIQLASVMQQSLTLEEQEALFAPYARLPSAPEESSEDIGLDFNPHSPPTPVALAVDACADDDLLDLPSIPDTPIGISQFEFGNRASFNTGVRDLIQSDPDSPIGGQPAAPMKRSFNVGILTAANGNMCGGRIPPRIEIISPTCCEQSRSRPLNCRSNFSDPFQEPLKSGKQPMCPSSPKSCRSTPMITAPESPRERRQSDNSGIPIPAMDFGETAVRDFALTENASTNPTGDLPEENVSMVCNDVLGDLDGLEETRCCESPSKTTSPTELPIASSAFDTQEFCPGPDLCPLRPQLVQELPILPGVPDVPSAAGVPTIPNAPAGPSIPAARIPTQVPLDATGILTAPDTPDLRRRGKRKQSFRKTIRKSRSKCLRTPLLSVLVGRQLAGPTKQALQAISKEQPVDLESISRIGSLSTVPAPVPVSA